MKLFGDMNIPRLEFNWRCHCVRTSFFDTREFENGDDGGKYGWLAVDDPFSLSDAMARRFSLFSTDQNSAGSHKWKGLVVAELSPFTAVADVGERFASHLFVMATAVGYALEHDLQFAFCSSTTLSDDDAASFEALGELFPGLGLYPEGKIPCADLYASMVMVGSSRSNHADLNPWLLFEEDRGHALPFRPIPSPDVLLKSKSALELQQPAALVYHHDKPYRITLRGDFQDPRHFSCGFHSLDPWGLSLSRARCSVKNILKEWVSQSVSTTGVFGSSVKRIRQMVRRMARGRIATVVSIRRDLHVASNASATSVAVAAARDLSSDSPPPIASFKKPHSLSPGFLKTSLHYYLTSGLAYDSSAIFAIITDDAASVRKALSDIRNVDSGSFLFLDRIDILSAQSTYNNSAVEMVVDAYAQIAATLQFDSANISNRLDDWWGAFLQQDWQWDDEHHRSVISRKDVDSDEEVKVKALDDRNRTGNVVIAPRLWYVDGLDQCERLLPGHWVGLFGY
jgi:hypothetical protein